MNNVNSSLVSISPSSSCSSSSLSSSSNKSNEVAGAHFTTDPQTHNRKPSINNTNQFPPANTNNSNRPKETKSFRKYGSNSITALSNISNSGPNNNLIDKFYNNSLNLNSKPYNNNYSKTTEFLDSIEPKQRQYNNNGQNLNASYSSANLNSSNKNKIKYQPQGHSLLTTFPSSSTHTTKHFYNSQIIASEVQKQFNNTNHQLSHSFSNFTGVKDKMSGKYENGQIYEAKKVENQAEDEFLKHFDSFKEIFNKIQEPAISEIEAQSVLVRLSPIVLDSATIKSTLLSAENITETDLLARFENVNYTLELKSETNPFNQVYAGDANEITLKDLKPNTKYSLR